MVPEAKHGAAAAATAAAPSPPAAARPPAAAVRPPRDENVVFVGNKPPMNYVLAIVTQFNAGSPDVILRARGKAISRCVDVAEIVRHKFVQDATIKGIAIATERVTNEEGRPTNVSSIEIVLTK